MLLMFIDSLTYYQLKAQLLSWLEHQLAVHLR